MKSNMVKMFYGSIIGIFFILIVICYKYNYNYWTSPPSDSWSKQIQISSGECSQSPKIIKYGNKYIIAHDDYDKIKIIVTDNLGKKVTEKSFDGKDKFILDVNLLTDGQYIYLNWITSSHMNRVVNYIKLDKNLNEKLSWQEKNAVTTAQIGDSIMLTAFKDRIELYDIKNNQKIHKSACADMITGTSTNKGYLIAYHENDDFKYFYVNNGIVSQAKLAVSLMKNIGVAWKNIAIAADSKYGYLMIEKYSKGETGEVILVNYELQGNKSDTRDLEMDSIRYFYDPIAVSSGTAARFIVGCSRMGLIKNKPELDFIDISIKNNNISKNCFATKSLETSQEPYAANNAMVFFSSANSSSNIIYMTSQNKDFKIANNLAKPIEKKTAISETMTNVLNSVIFVPFIGIRWIVMGIIPIALMSFFLCDAGKERIKKYTYLGICAATTAVKLYSIYDYAYVKNYELLPSYLSNCYMVLGICALISIGCYTYTYGEYINDIDKMPILSFVKGLLIDSVLTILLISPYIL